MAWCESFFPKLLYLQFVLTFSKVVSLLSFGPLFMPRYQKKVSRSLSISPLTYHVMFFANLMRLKQGVMQKPFTGSTWKYVLKKNSWNELKWVKCEQMIKYIISTDDFVDSICSGSLLIGRRGVASIPNRRIGCLLQENHWTSLKPINIKRHKIYHHNFQFISFKKSNVQFKMGSTCDSPGCFSLCQFNTKRLTLTRHLQLQARQKSGRQLRDHFIGARWRRWQKQTWSSFDSKKCSNCRFFSGKFSAILVPFMVSGGFLLKFSETYECQNGIIPKNHGKSTM